jgi:hypothetical protein
MNLTETLADEILTHTPQRCSCHLRPHSSIYWLLCIRIVGVCIAQLAAGKALQGDHLPIHMTAGTFGIVDRLRLASSSPMTSTSLAFLRPVNHWDALWQAFATERVINLYNVHTQPVYNPL